MNLENIQNFNRLIFHTTALALFLFAPFSSADTDENLKTEHSSAALPKWEIGLAGALLSIPHYVGSDQRHTLPVAAPFLIYRGDFFKSDREGVRGELFRTPSLNLDISFSFGLPAKSDNTAREGMPDLRLTGQIGPRLNWTIFEPEIGPTISLHLPFRYVRDIKNTNLGWVADPSLRIEQDNMGSEGKYSARMDAGVFYADSPYNQYYYEVRPQFANSARPAYEPESGLNHYFIHLSGSYTLSKKLKLGGFARWKLLQSGAISDSPLVRNKHYLAAGLGLSWIFKQAQ